ncbi:hypothetical protein ACP70R_016975 [Stipagrostis hirtigluma subsp. patula]
MQLRVAVIGAGAAGLAAARELRREGHGPVVFERASCVGGTWVYDPDAPADSLAAGATHSSLYASLRTNLPREAMGFLDFPFAAGPDAGDPRRYPAHQEVLRYIDGFARRFDLHRLVRLHAEVLSVRRRHDQASSSWKVRWRKVGDGQDEEEEEAFDAVVVCNGHYTEPRVADIPGTTRCCMRGLEMILDADRGGAAGVDAWPGKQMHSHSYRVPDPFLDQVVVIIGAQNSGADISRELAGVAREVHMANKSAPAHTCQTLPGYHNLWLRSMVERAEEDGSVVFQDGSSIKADVIMHCTGYKYSFPFLGDDSSITVDDNRIDPLYKHVFPPHVAPRLSFIGLPFRVLAFPMFQLQSNWVAGALSGRFQLPSKQEMMQDVRTSYSELEALGWPKRYTHCLDYTQFEYNDWLAEQCGHQKIEEWRKEMLDAYRKKRVDCPETYREEWDDDLLLEQAHQDFQKYF